MRKAIIATLLVAAVLVMAACGGQAAPAAPAAATTAAEATTEATAETTTEATTEATVEATTAVTGEATVEATAEVTTEASAGAASAAVTLPEVDPLTVKGDIIAAGSSTVYPLAERMAEIFVEDGYAGNITIDSVGTGGGFERFCKAGETDIANASRPIKDAEKENCAAIGRTPVEFRVGTDALAIVVNPENTWVGETGVTKEELAKLFSKEYTNWADVNPAWPAEPIKRFSPGTDSGTFDYFVEAVMDPMYVKDATADKGKGEEALLGAGNLQLSEDDNVLVQGVEGDKNAIGYFGFAYFEENAGKLRDLAVEGVAPSAETVNAGEYPLARPLFIYSDAKVMQDKPQVAAFINFFLSNVNDEITGVGYFPAAEDALNAAKQNWLTATGQ
jgi:phosphate transport system substrate-binding protein